ncbi:MAG TPA: hypothetical protein VFL04_05615 [Rectinemataceae bacterium]|nr:hypothetical protein [Rectinemataceae bacterium]
MGSLIIAILVLGSLSVGAVVLAGYLSRSSQADRARLSPPEEEEDGLEQRLLSIEGKIRDLAMLRKVLGEVSSEVDVHSIVEKQDGILSYLSAYHDKYSGLVLMRQVGERLKGLLSGELGVEAKVQGIVELKKEAQQRYLYLRERSVASAHDDLDRRKLEADRHLDAVLRDLVVVETNRIIASESPLTRIEGIERDEGAIFEAEGTESEAELNREYDRFISEIELA